MELAQVRLLVTDFPACYRFYSEVLGLKPQSGAAEGPYELPDYLKSNNTAARVLLTPLAVAADSLMVGLVASVVGAYMLAKANYGSVH